MTCANAGSAHSATCLSAGAGGPRHHAEDTFAADEQLLQVDAGVVLDVFAQALQHRAVGGDDFETENQVAGHAVADDAVAAGIGRDVAADGATAARAEVERKHQAVLLDPLLELLQRRAGLHDSDAGGGVDLFDRVHALHREHDLVRIRQRAAHQAGHAALRRDRHAVAMTEPEQGGDILGRLRADDRARFRHRIARQVVMIARVDIGADQHRAVRKRVAQFVDEAVGHAPAFFGVGPKLYMRRSGMKPFAGA
jgi:hypothetical protein